MELLSDGGETKKSCEHNGDGRARDQGAYYSHLSHPNDCVSRVDGYKNKICVLLVVIVACTKSAAPRRRHGRPLGLWPISAMMSSPHGMAHGTDRATARDTWTVSSKMAIVSTKSPSAGSSGRPRKQRLATRLLSRGLIL